MKYLYNIGYYSCEESRYRQYFHEQKFSNKELNALIADCLEDVLKGVLRRGAPQGITFQSLMEMDQIWIKKRKEYVLVHPSFEVALRQRGFRPAKFTAEFRIFGWASSVELGGWSSYTDDQEVKLQEHLKAVYDEWMKKHRKHRTRKKKSK